MNKGDLIDSVASRLGETRAAAARAVDAVFDALLEGVKSNDRVLITGFGAFEKKTRAARRGVNPATKERMMIEARTTIGFRPAEKLKEELEGVRK